MKRLWAAVCAALMCVSFGCGAAGGRQAPEPLPSAPTKAAAARTPTIPPPPPPTPVPTPPPTPVPCVNAQWYVDRNDELADLLWRDGSFQSEQEVEDAIERMWIDPDRPMVALTFDDGPVPGVTDKILDILEEYNVRATFFVLGVRLKKPEAAEIARRAVALGCEIGNHTWKHEKLTAQNYVEKMSAIQSTNEIVYEETGFTVRLLRPPGGSSDAEVRNVAKKCGLAVVKWSQSGNVYEKDPKRIAQNVQKQIVNGKELHDGDIILLHDTKERMIDAVAIIVPQLLDEGYQLVTVWELLNCSENGCAPGEMYKRQ